MNKKVARGQTPCNFSASLFPQRMLGQHQPSRLFGLPDDHWHQLFSSRAHTEQDTEIKLNETKNLQYCK